MSHNVLLTGVSGYIGGQVAVDISKAGSSLRSHSTIYALIRTDAQAEAVKQYGMVPLKFDIHSEEDVFKAILHYEISIVFWLVDSLDAVPPKVLLESIGGNPGRDPRRQSISCIAKMFSSLAGAPTDHALYDTDPNLHDLQKAFDPAYEILRSGVAVNTEVIELGTRLGVRTYILIPCMVYGESEGFGKKISMQTTYTVKIAVKLRHVYNLASGQPEWPVCHISDTSSLYLALLQRMLSGEELDYGEKGFYHAASGFVTWDKFYEAVAQSLHRRGAIDTNVVTMANDVQLAAMSAALGLGPVPEDFVTFLLSGKCTLTADHGHQLGWTPKKGPEHFLASTDAEVDLILRYL